MKFWLDERAFEVFGAATFIPATPDEEARFTCDAFVGGELREVELNGGDAEDVAAQLGMVDLDLENDRRAA